MPSMRWTRRLRKGDVDELDRLSRRQGAVHQGSEEGAVHTAGEEDRDARFAVVSLRQCRLGCTYEGAGAGMFSTRRLTDAVNCATKVSTSATTASRPIGEVGRWRFTGATLVWCQGGSGWWLTGRWDSFNARVQSMSWSVSMRFSRGSKSQPHPTDASTPLWLAVATR